MRYYILILLPNIMLAQDICYQSLMQRATENSISCDSLLNYCIDKQAYLEQGYLGAALMIKAKHIKGTYKKWNSFKKGKKKLEYAISQQPQSIELRKIRYHIQNNSPNFLNYKKNLKEDEFFITKNKID